MVYYERERPISTSIRLSVMTSGFGFTFGLIFLVFGSVFLIIFGTLASADSPKVSGKAVETQATIINYYGTNTTVNDRTVMCYEYEYKHTDGTVYQGKAYSDEVNYEVGYSVPIKYQLDAPEISESLNMRSSMVPAWVVLIILPFVLIGGGFLGYSLWRNTKSLKLIRIGQIAYGKYLYKEPTNTRINNQTVYRYTFEFEANGQKYHATADTHKPNRILDEAQERLVYDPMNPEEAVIIDSLPKVVRKYFDNLDKTGLNYSL